MPRKADYPIDVSRPFSRATALAAGMTAKQLRGPGLTRLFRATYVGTPFAGHVLTLARAALLLHEAGAAVSHHSAAHLLGAAVPSTPYFHVTVRHPDDRRHHEGLRSHVDIGLADEHLVHLDDVAVVGPVSLFVSLAAVLDLVDLVVVGDALVRRGHLSAEQLSAALSGREGRLSDRARRAAAYVRDGVDSPMETRLRMLIVLAGLPEPKVNVIVYRANGSVRYRFDLCYPDVRLIIEYDGRQHADDAKQWRGDLEQREWLDDHDYRIVVVTSAGIYVEPGRTLERVRAKLVDAGHPGVPRRLRPTWRRYFADRV